MFFQAFVSFFFFFKTYFSVSFEVFYRFFLKGFFNLLIFLEVFFALTCRDHGSKVPLRRTEESSRAGLGCLPRWQSDGSSKSRLGQGGAKLSGQPKHQICDVIAQTKTARMCFG